MLAFRSLDPFRALREPDRRRRDEERLSRSEQRTLSKTQNNHLTGKAPYKFESGLLQRTVRLSPAPLSKTKNLGFPRGCGRSAWRLGRQRRAGCFEIAPTGGNISVAPYSSTAVPLIGSARMPLRFR